MAQVPGVRRLGEPSAPLVGALGGRRCLPSRHPSLPLQSIFERKKLEDVSCRNFGTLLGFHFSGGSAMEKRMGAIMAEKQSSKLILLSVAVMQFLAALDQTIVSTALPTVVADFGRVDHLSWVVMAYLLTSIRGALPPCPPGYFDKVEARGCLWLAGTFGGCLYRYRRTILARRAG